MMDGNPGSRALWYLSGCCLAIPMLAGLSGCCMQDCETKFKPLQGAAVSLPIQANGEFDGELLASAIGGTSAGQDLAAELEGKQFKLKYRDVAPAPSTESEPSSLWLVRSGTVTVGGETAKPGQLVLFPDRTAVKVAGKVHVLEMVMPGMDFDGEGVVELDGRREIGEIGSFEVAAELVKADPTCEADFPAEADEQPTLRLVVHALGGELIVRPTRQLARAYVVPFGRMVRVCAIRAAEAAQALVISIAAEL